MRHIIAKKCAIARLIEFPGSQFPYSVGCVFFVRGEAKAVEFEEENPNNKTGALVAIHERMVAHDASRICGGKAHEVGRLSVSLVLLRPSESRMQESLVAQTLRAAMQNK